MNQRVQLPYDLRVMYERQLDIDPRLDGVAMQLLKSGFFATKDVG